MIKPSLFVFDLDDTLMDNVHDYAEPILEMSRVIIKELGPAAPHVSALIALEQEIDKRRVKEVNPDTGKPFGYTMERFPGTMVETYRAVCAKSGITPEPRIESNLYRIGMLAFDKAQYKQNIKPNALHLLKTLHENRCEVVILTKGDPRVQNLKVEALKTQLKQSSGDANAITGYTIVEVVKTAEEFNALRLLSRNRHDAPYAIGNDYDKDIVPALAAHPSFRGIWIPVETWETLGTTDTTLKRMDERCVMLNSLLEVEAYLRKM